MAVDIQHGFTATMWRSSMRRHLAMLVSVAMPLLVPPAVYGFGASAHQIVGHVAENYICSATRQAIVELVPEPSLAEMGLWADRIRSNPAWDIARPWHYINVPDDMQLADAVRRSSGDVLTAIDLFAAQLQDAALTNEQRQQALYYLVHFVADVHQPLHVGRLDDRGGNNVRIRFGGQKTNLHSYWDSAVLEGVSRSSEDYATRLIASNHMMATDWQASGPEDWAIESQALRREVYDFGPPDKSGRVLLDADYQARALEIVDLRMAQAGIRLAGMLNSIWCPD